MKLNKETLRFILNMLFITCAIAAVIVYFTIDDQTTYLFVCGVAILIKFAERFSRMMP